MKSKIQNQQFFYLSRWVYRKKNYKNLLTVDGCTCIGLLTDNPFNQFFSIKNYIKLWFRSRMEFRIKSIGLLNVQLSVPFSSYTFLTLVFLYHDHSSTKSTLRISWAFCLEWPYSFSSFIFFQTKAEYKLNCLVFSFNSAEMSFFLTRSYFVS